MKYDQYRALVAAFEDTANKLCIINGLAALTKGTPALEYPNRKLALKLNNVFARLIDHSRVGTLEVQSRKADWECPEMSWDGQFGWKQFFRDIGFEVYEDDLEPGQDFALNVVRLLPVGHGVKRDPTRPLDPEEQSEMETMMEQARLYKDKIEALNAASAEAPPRVSTPE